MFLREKKPSFAANFLRTDTIGKDGAGWLLKNKSHFGSSGLIGRLEGLLQKEGGSLGSWLLEKR